MANAPSKKNMILAGVAAAVLVISVLLLYRDSLFGGTGGTGPAPLDQATAEKVAENVGESFQAEPDPVNPPPKGSGKAPH